MSKITPGYFFTAQGRIPRSEMLLYFLLPAVIWDVIFYALTPTGILLAVWMIIGLVIGIANLFGDIRRYHDRDKSGWWILICLIPIIGSIWLIVELFFLKGTDGPNRFGVNPLA